MPDDCPDCAQATDLVALRVSLVGESGNNGRLGTLRADLDAVRAEARFARKLLWSIGGVVLALAGVAAPLLYGSAREAAAAREQMERRVLVIETRLEMRK